MYVQPCEDKSDDDDEAMCTGERKGEGEGVPACSPFKFEEPATCTEIDIEILPKDFASMAEDTPTSTSPSASKDDVLSVSLQ